MTDMTAGAEAVCRPANGRRRHRRVGAALLVLLCGATMGCSLVDNNELPADVSDPARTQTPNGARAAYAGTVAQFGRAFGGDLGGYDYGSFIPQTGLLTDELVTDF